MKMIKELKGYAVEIILVMIVMMLYFAISLIGAYLW